MAAKWLKNGQGFAIANQAFRFPACKGAADFSCSISAIGGSSKGDVFTYSPAVVANHRIDDITNPGGVLDEGDRNQFLLALASGNPNDTAIDAGDSRKRLPLAASTCSSTITAPTNTPASTSRAIGATTTPGSHPHFMRLPLNQIQRTRHVVFPDGTSETRLARSRSGPGRSVPR